MPLAGGQHQVFGSNGAVDVDKAPFFVFLVAVERLADVAQNEHDASGIFGKGRPALNVAQIGQNLAVVNDQKLPRLAVVRGRGILGALMISVRVALSIFWSVYLRTERRVIRPSIISMT